MYTGVAAPPTSEFVRQELRAVVGARTAQAQPTQVRTTQAQQQMMQQQVGELDGLGLGFDMAAGKSDDFTAYFGVLVIFKRICRQEILWKSDICCNFVYM